MAKGRDRFFFLLLIYIICASLKELRAKSVQIVDRIGSFLS
jgi:hypothetical protein